MCWKNFDTKEEIKTSNDKWTIYKTMLPYCLNCRKTQKVKIQINLFLLVVLHHQKIHELSSLRFLNLNLEWQWERKT